MMKNKEYPEEDELVLCTVKDIKKSQVFVNIDSYNKEGVLQFSEVAPGRIRNIRDFVVPGRKIVCKILRVFKDTGHIDLSLRRVSAKEREEVMKSYTKERDSESLLNAILKEDFVKIRENILKKYKSFYEFLAEFLKNNKIAKEVGIKPQFVDEIVAEIKKRFKEKEVKKTYIIEAKTTSNEGIFLIKEFFGKLNEKGIEARYISAPRYEIIIKGKNFQDINKKLGDIKGIAALYLKKFDFLTIKEKS